MLNSMLCNAPKEHFWSITGGVDEALELIWWAAAERQTEKLWWPAHLDMSWYAPVTRKSVKIRRQQQQKLTGLWEAANEGRKRRLQASLHKHNTAAPSNTPSMATTEQHIHAGQHIEKLVFFLPRGEEAQEFQALCWLKPTPTMMLNISV